MCNVSCKIGIWTLGLKAIGGVATGVFLLDLPTITKSGLLERGEREGGVLTTNLGVVPRPRKVGSTYLRQDAEFRL